MMHGGDGRKVEVGREPKKRSSKVDDITRQVSEDLPKGLQNNSADTSDAVLLKQVEQPDAFIADELLIEDQSTVVINSQRLVELELSEGDTVILVGKRNRKTIATVTSDADLSSNRIRVSKVGRANLRIKLGDVIRLQPLKEVKIASRVNILPFSDSLQGITGDIFDVFLKPYFIDRFLPVKVGDIFYARGGMRTVDFKFVYAESSEGEELEYCIIGPETVITYEGEPLGREEDPTLTEPGYDEIGGCSRQLGQIRELVELPLRHPQLFRVLGIPPPKGILLHGPPGSGKTIIAKAIAAETGAYLAVLNGPELTSKVAGETESNLRKLFAEAEKHAPSIIFIDEIDSIAPKREKANDADKKVVAQLLTLMDGIKPTSNVVIIGATNRPNVLDPALRRFGRFDREIEVGIPDDKGRLEILRIKTRNMKLHDDVNIENIAKSTHGYVGADLAQLCLEAAFEAIREKLPFVDISTDNIPVELLDSIHVANKHFLKALNIVNPSSIRESVVEVPTVSWKDVGGLEDVKKELFESIQYPILHGDLFQRFGMKPSRGILFYGPPGCGKTLLAKAIANECGANFISIKGPELLTMWFGESEANVRELFDKARAASPCILFFDELDSIAKARSSGGGAGSEALDRVINQILTEIDGIASKKSVIVIGATNRPDILDSAITRPGRLDQLIYIPLPDLETRMNIFKACLRNAPVAENVSIEVLAKATTGFSGADIAEICQRAARCAVRECVEARTAYVKKLQVQENDPKAFEYPLNAIQRKHFEEAMSVARRSVSDEEIKRFEQFKKKIARSTEEAGAGSKFSFHDNESQGDKASIDDDEDLYKPVDE